MTDLRAITTLCDVLSDESVCDDIVDSGARDALAVAELLCEAIVEDGLAALVVLSGKGRILYANDAFAALLGAEPSALVDRAIDDLLHPAQLDAAAALIHGARLAPSQPVRGDFRIRRSDGGWRPVRMVVRASPLSAVGNMLCGVLDLGPRAPATAIGEVGDRQQAVVSIDSALDAIVSMDADGAICAFNNAAEEMFGLPRKQAIGRTVGELLIPGVHRAAHREGVLRHLRTGDSAVLDRRLELSALHADGQEFPVEITVTWTGDGAGRCYTAFIRNISEHKQLLANLRAATDRLAAVVQAQQQVAISDLDASALIDLSAGLARDLLDGAGAWYVPLPEPIGPAEDDVANDGAAGPAVPVLSAPLASSNAPPVHGAASVASIDAAIDPPAAAGWPSDRALAVEGEGGWLAAAPLVAGERVLGHLVVLAPYLKRFDDTDAHALELFATALGAEVQRRRSAERQAQLVLLQREFSTSSLDVEPLMALVAERIQVLFDGDGAAVEWLDGDELSYVAASGRSRAHVGLRLARRGSFSGLCATLGEALVCRNLLTDTRFDTALAARLGIRSMVVAPLRYEGAIVGVLKVSSSLPQRFTAADGSRLELLAESVAAIVYRRRMTHVLRQSDAQYRALFDRNPSPMWVADGETLRFVAVNDAALALYGYSQAEFLAMHALDVRLADAPDVAALTDDVEHVTSRHLCRDGRIIDVALRQTTIDFAGKPARLVMAVDMTERNRAAAAEARATRAQRLLSACNAALVRIADEQRLLDEICHSIVELGGYQLAGIGFATVPGDGARLVPKAASSADEATVDTMFAKWAEITANEQCPSARAVNDNSAVTHADLHDCPEQPWCRVALECGFGSAISLPLCNEGVAFGFLSMYAAQPDVMGDDELGLLQELADNAAFGIFAIRAEAERKRFLAELAYGASHDAVTGLERYALLEHRLARGLGLSGQVTSVVLLDLDRFNSVNETVGHAAADEILRVVGARLMAFADTRMSVAHFASDEFVVVMSGVGPELAGVLTEAMRAAIAMPIEGDGYSVALTATAGISHSPAHGRDARGLVRRAQAAAERGKRAGRDCSHAFLAEQMQEIDDRALLGGRLRQAAEQGEMRLHYQPQYAASGQLTGFEALLRWHSAEFGAVSPARFIPIAETLGLMPVLGEWVVREACRQARAWLDAGHSGFRIAVNVSGQQLVRPGLVRVVSGALQDFDIPAQLLELELTESSLMENVAVVQGTLAELKALGVTLSLDDFGTGYSSLAYLKNFSLDKLKIDQSFVHGLPGNANDAAIARTIVSMGHQLRLLVAAEGVETREQADFLRHIGCDELQGYHFGHPLLPGEAVLAFEAD